MFYGKRRGTTAKRWFLFGKLLFKCTECDTVTALVPNVFKIKSIQIIRKNVFGFIKAVAKELSAFDAVGSAKILKRIGRSKSLRRPILAPRSAVLLR